MTKKITQVTHYKGAWGIEQISIEWTNDTGESGVTIGRPNNPVIIEMLSNKSADSADHYKNSEPFVS